MVFTTSKPTRPTRGEPAKLVLERRARPGKEAAFEAWVRSLVIAAESTEVLQGSSVLVTPEGDTLVLLRFESSDALEIWLASEPVEELMREGHALSAHPEEPVVRTGFETWFRLPGHAAPPAAPPRWKMALVTWLALLPQVLVLAVIVPDTIPLVPSVALSTAIPVALLAWLVMPLLTRLLYRWLYAPIPAKAVLAASGGDPR